MGECCTGSGDIGRATVQAIVFVECQSRFGVAFDSTPVAKLCTGSQPIYIVEFNGIDSGDSLWG